MKQLVKYIVRDTEDSEAEVLRIWAQRMMPDWRVHSTLEAAKSAAKTAGPQSVIYQATVQMERIL